MEEINCIFCNKENEHTVIEENGYSGKKCATCGLIYISPRPSLNEILNLYGHASSHSSAKSQTSVEFSSRLYAKHNLKILHTYAQKGDILEIGAGAGFFLDEARNLGFNPYGIEFNPVQAHFIRDNLNIPCEEKPLSSYVFKGKKFDVIYHCDVISHFFDPVSEFNEIHHHMNNDGILLFETGNLGEVKKKYFKYFSIFQYPDHLFFFHTDNLIKLLETTGFELVHIYRYSILPQLIALKILTQPYMAIKQLMIKFKPRKKCTPNTINTQKPSGAVLQTSQTNSIIKRILRMGYGYLNYILRYKVGRIVPKKHRPQTVVVVARKRIRN